MSPSDCGLLNDECAVRSYQIPHHDAPDLGLSDRSVLELDSLRFDTDLWLCRIRPLSRGWSGRRGRAAVISITLIALAQTGILYERPVSDEETQAGIIYCTQPLDQLPVMAHNGLRSTAPCPPTGSPLSLAEAPRFPLGIVSPPPSSDQFTLVALCFPSLV